MMVVLARVVHALFLGLLIVAIGVLQQAVVLMHGLRILVMALLIQTKINLLNVMFVVSGDKMNYKFKVFNI